MAKSSSRSSGRSGGSSVMAGVLIGLAIAAALAVGVALWVTGNSPFKSATPAPAAGPVAPPPTTPELAPSFDFYKVLPGDAPAELPAEASPAAPVVRYFLQAGAFQNPADADNLKAQLALLGIEAAIQTTDVPDKGIFHRVRIGPFRDMSEVERTRERLAQNNLPATLVKETPTH